MFFSCHVLFLHNFISLVYFKQQNVLQPHHPGAIMIELFFIVTDGMGKQAEVFVPGNFLCWVGLTLRAIFKV